MKEMSPWEQTKGKGPLVCFVSYSGCGVGGRGGGTVRLFMEAMQHQYDCVFSYLLVFKEKV